MFTYWDICDFLTDLCDTSRSTSVIDLGFCSTDYSPLESFMKVNGKKTNATIHSMFSRCVI